MHFARNHSASDRLMYVGDCIRDNIEVMVRCFRAAEHVFAALLPFGLGVSR